MNSMSDRVQSRYQCMRRENRTLIVSIVLVTAFSPSGALTQERQSDCPPIKYSARMTHAQPFRLKAIAGQVVYGEGSQKGELNPASNICLDLFAREDKHLVATVRTESGGQFNFVNIPPGKYLLSVFGSALHEISVPVEVAERDSVRAFKPWRLLLHVRSKDDRKMSFVTPITQPLVRAELLKLVQEDQAIRNEQIRKGSAFPDQAITARMAVIDAAGTVRMKEIVKRYGWPGPDLVGQDGADAAFMLVQHSPDYSFEQAMLPLVRQSYKSGKLSAWNYALLVDRVRVHQGKPQLYGMSVNHWAGKEPVFDPIGDEADVDQRRAKLGLPPLRDYVEIMKRLYFPTH